MSSAPGVGNPGSTDAGGVRAGDGEEGEGFLGILLVTLAVILPGRLVLWALEHGAGIMLSSAAVGAGAPAWLHVDTGAFWALAPSCLRSGATRSLGCSAVSKHW